MEDEFQWERGFLSHNEPRRPSGRTGTRGCGDLAAGPGVCGDPAATPGPGVCGRLWKSHSVSHPLTFPPAEEASVPGGCTQAAQSLLWRETQDVKVFYETVSVKKKVGHFLI